MQSAINRKRWIHVGVIFAWLMMLGGLVGMLSGQMDRSVLLPIVVAGTLMNVTLLNVSRRLESTPDPRASQRGAGPTE